MRVPRKRSALLGLQTIAISTENKNGSQHRFCGRRAEETSVVVLRQLLIAAAVLSCVLFAPSRSYSERMPNKDDCVVLELSALGKPGDTIARAREQVIDILQNGNACSAWFEEADPGAPG